MGCSSQQTLTEQSRCRERDACALISRCCSSTNNHRDSLKFVQEVARLVTSHFFGKEKKSLGGSEKSLSWQQCTHLYYSPLSLSDCSKTRIFRRTHTYRNFWTTANRGGGGGGGGGGGVRPSLSSGLDHDMGLMCVCCWTTGRLSESQTFFFLDRLDRLDQIGRTLEPYHWATVQFFFSLAQVRRLWRQL